MTQEVDKTDTYQKTSQSCKVYPILPPEDSKSSSSCWPPSLMGLAACKVHGKLKEFHSQEHPHLCRGRLSEDSAAFE